MKTTTKSALLLKGQMAVCASMSQGSRECQEDAYDWREDANDGSVFVVVADGAGGHGGGDIASQAAVACAATFFRDHAMPDDPAGFLKQWMGVAHRDVAAAATRLRRSCRAVVVACVASKKSLHWVHAGDCRVIRFRNGKFGGRTRDDSVVQILVDQGEITEAEMGTHPDQSRLLQSLGGEEPPTPRLGSVDWRPGDSVILCSDGFWEYLTTPELEKLVATEPAGRCRALELAVDTAVRRGGAKADNATAVMLHREAGVVEIGGMSINTFLVLMLGAIIVGVLLGLLLVELSARSNDGKTSDMKVPPIHTGK